MKSVREKVMQGVCCSFDGNALHNNSIVPLPPGIECNEDELIYGTNCVDHPYVDKNVVYQEKPDLINLIGLMHEGVSDSFVELNECEYVFFSFDMQVYTRDEPDVCSQGEKVSIMCPLSCDSMNDDSNDVFFLNNEFVRGHKREGIGDSKFEFIMWPMFLDTFYHHESNNSLRFSVEFQKKK